MPGSNPTPLDLATDVNPTHGFNFVDWDGIGAPAVSPAGSARLYFDSGTLTWRISQNGAAYLNVLSGGGGGTLDDAYDFGGAGAGRMIVADAGAVDIANAIADATNGLEVSKSAGSGAAITADATGSTGPAIAAIGDVTISGKLTVVGAIDPTSVLLSGGTALFYESNDGSTAPVSGAATGRLRYNNASAAWQISTQAGAYSNVITAATLGTTVFVQDGNSFGALATLGTNDAFDLAFETGGVERGRFVNTTGNLRIVNALERAIAGSLVIRNTVSGSEVELNANIGGTQQAIMSLGGLTAGYIKCLEFADTRTVIRNAITIGAGAVWTLSTVGINYGAGLNFNPTMTLAVNASPFATYSLFQASPIVQNSVGSTRTAGPLIAFINQPTVQADGGSFTVSITRDYIDQPTFTRIGAGVMAVTEWTQYYAAGQVFVGATITTRRGFWFVNPTTATGAITTNIGLDIDDQTIGTTRIGIRSAMTAGAGKYGFQFRTAQSYHAGNLRVGSAVDPTVPLDVTGAARFAGDMTMVGNFDFVPSVDNTGEIGTDALRFNRIRATNIVSGDLHLQDEARNAHWTLREDTDRIVAINQITGKRYEVALKEIA